MLPVFPQHQFDKSIVVVVDGSGSLVEKNLVEVEVYFYFKKR